MFIFGISTVAILSTNEERKWVSAAERSKGVGMPGIVLVTTLKFLASFATLLKFLNLGQKESACLRSNLIVGISPRRNTISGHVVHVQSELLICCPGSDIFLFELTHALHHGL